MVVRNTQIGGYWGPEETDGGFPLQPGKHFEAVIIVQEECYKVSYTPNKKLVEVGQNW